MRCRRWPACSSVASSGRAVRRRQCPGDRCRLHDGHGRAPLRLGPRRADGHAARGGRQPTIVWLSEDPAVRDCRLGPRRGSPSHESAARVFLAALTLVSSCSATITACISAPARLRHRLRYLARRRASPRPTVSDFCRSGGRIPAAVGDLRSVLRGLVEYLKPGLEFSRAEAETTVLRSLPWVDLSVDGRDTGQRGSVALLSVLRGACRLAGDRLVARAERT